MRTLNVFAYKSEMERDRGQLCELLMPNVRRIVTGAPSFIRLILFIGSFLVDVCK